jgi:hypothetical protein
VRRVPLPIVALLPLVLALPWSESVRADGSRLPTGEEIESRFAQGERLTGREIYRRFLRNKFRSSLQRLTVTSEDPGGHQQVTQMLARWKDYRDEDDRPRDGVIAKTVVRIERPFDLRKTAYLLIARKGMPHEQFVYLPSGPSARRVRRIWLRGIGLLGTDYTLDDLLFQTVEDAEYERLPDDAVASIPVYVVEARLKSFFDSQYERVTAYVHKENYVLLRARYRDDSGTLLRELVADVDSIDEFDGVWVATRATMRNLREGTTSTLVVHHLVPNLQLDDRLFSTFYLENRRN